MMKHDETTKALHYKIQMARSLLITQTYTVKHHQTSFVGPSATEGSPRPAFVCTFFLHAVARFGDALPSTSVCDGLIWFKGSAMVVIEGC